MASAKDPEEDYAGFEFVQTYIAVHLLGRCWSALHQFMGY